MSELFANIRIEISEDDEIFSFEPGMSLKDGKLLGESWIYDLSIYDDKMLEGNQKADLPPEEYCYQLLCEIAEVQDYLDQGMSILYSGMPKEMDGNTYYFYDLGTDHDEHFVAEFNYAVSLDGKVLKLNILTGEWESVDLG